MRVCRSTILPLAWVLLATMAPPLWAAGRVRLELVGQRHGSALVFQDWLRVLSRAGVKNVRIRPARPTDKVGIDVRGSEASPLYVVTGIVKSGDELILPGGRYRRRDAARLARWLDELAEHGPADQREQSLAFGLSAEQFEQVRRDLARPVGFSTQGISRHETVQQ
ncbi:unnamed protein product, partial [marine sediment metagenome]